MVNGSVTFNAVTDAELGRALEFKSKHEQLSFNPMTMQPAPGQQGLYNNMVISWSTNDSYQSAHELIELMLGKSKPDAPPQR
jgi:hypothetical protein